ncbi:MAG: tRNA epoxyqueuosine(34) reductase QueG [Candidatus Latescibacterota bacterium]
MDRTKDKIREKALALGFTLFGVTTVDPLQGAGFYAEWIERGYAGTMDYLKRNVDKRGDVRALVPGAQSVLSLGMEYWQSTPEVEDDGRPRGRFAAYARGDDYHDVIKERLFALWDFIREEVDTTLEGRVYVDTAPVLERELAQRSGLGWWGKNTCLINKRRGSHFFLAEVVSTLALPPDGPATDHCGTCTRCMDACPTDAFPEPYVLDAQRCISYLTIELKGAIPRALRKGMGDWVYGCDICQDVCPWNRRAEPACEPAYESRAGFERPDLIEWMALDRETFNKTFRRNPAKRPKRRGLLRNVAVALGNSGDPRAVAPLIGALDDEEALVRSHAAWGLARLGAKQACAALQARLAVEEDAEVREEIEWALRQLEREEHA